jgi:hypothetical protein
MLELEGMVLMTMEDGGTRCNLLTLITLLDVCVGHSAVCVAAKAFLVAGCRV